MKTAFLSFRTKLRKTPNRRFRSVDTPAGKKDDVEPKQDVVDTKNIAELFENPHFENFLQPISGEVRSRVNLRTAYLPGDSTPRRRRVHDFMREKAERPCKYPSTLQNLSNFLRMIKDEPKVNLKNCLNKEFEPDVKSAVVSSVREYLETSKVKKLDLSFNPKFNFFEVFSGLEPNLSNIEELIFSGNSLEDDQLCQALAKFIKTQTNLTRLYLAVSNLNSHRLSIFLPKLPKSLRHLDISNNYFEDPLLLSRDNIPLLESLGLASCMITETHINMLCEWINNPKNQTPKSLNLENNDLGSTRVPPDHNGNDGESDGESVAECIQALVRRGAFLGSLTDLNLSNNELETADGNAIADALFRSNKSLTSLSLLYNRFDTDGVQRLLGLKNNNLKTLCGFSHKEKELNFQRVDKRKLSKADVMLIAPELRLMGSLTSLNLAGNDLNAEGAMALVDGGAFKGSLTSLNLAGNIPHGSKEGPAFAKALVEGGAFRGSLTSLNLSRNQLKAEGAKALVVGGAFTGSLTSLDLAGNKLCETDEDGDDEDGDDEDGDDEDGDGEYTVEGINALSEAIRDSGSLTRLDLRSNNLNAVGAKALVDGGAFTGSLTSIDLVDNYLDAEAAEALAPAIRDSGSLTSLDLSMNDLRAEGAKALVDGGAFTGSLTSLDVRYNSIVGDGATQLSAAVLSNPKVEKFNEVPIKEMRADSLTELNLNQKGIGIVGGMVVAGLMPVMGSLTRLNLRGNNLNAEGAKALVEGGAFNGSLTACDLQFNQLDEQSKKLLRDSVKGRPSFKLEL